MTTSTTAITIMVMAHPTAIKAPTPIAITITIMTSHDTCKNVAMLLGQLYQ